MRMLLVVALMAGCSDPDDSSQPDAGVPDASVDAMPAFFGEACDLPNVPGYPQAIALCHDDQGFCVDIDKDGAGECRPWCHSEGQFNPTFTCVGEQHGGRVTWTTDGTDIEDGPYLCVCLPPE